MQASVSLVALFLAAGAPYKTQADGAERVPNLGRFLEAYLGDCMSDEPTFDKKGCLEDAARVQKEKNGRLMESPR